MRPYSYQQEILDAHGDDDAVLLAMDLGTGKTATATWIAQRREHDSVLIVGPVRTFPGWKRMVDAILGREVRYVGNGKKVDKAARDAILADEPGWFFVGWEMMRALNTEKRFDGRARREITKSVDKPFGGRVFDVVIADEWHRASSRKSLNFQVISRVRSRRRLALSGTPAGSLPVNIWAAYAWLWPSLVPSFTRFADRWFLSEPNPFGGYPGARAYGREVRPGMVRSLVPAHLTVSGRDAHPDMPEVNVQRVACKMTRAQSAMYQQWKRDALVWLDGHPVAADIPAVIDTRLRQTTLGDLTVIGTDRNGDDVLGFDRDCKSGKIDALLDVLSDLPGKHVVYTHSAKFLIPLRNRLEKAGYRVAEVSGADRDGWQTFVTDDSVDVLMAVIPAVAEGVDGLQKVCHTEHWLSQDNSVVLNQQATGRLHRGGQDHVVTRYLYQCPGTVDTEAVSVRLAEKYGDLEASGLI